MSQIIDWFQRTKKSKTTTKLTNMDKQKQDALKRIEAIELEAKELRKIITTPNNRPITERVKTFDDILKEANTTKEEWDIKVAGMSPNTVAYERVKLISEVLNEGNKLDWSNPNQYKYYPWLEWNNKRSGFVFANAHCNYSHSGAGLGPRLCFYTRELAHFAGTQFEAEYNALLTT